MAPSELQPTTWIEDVVREWPQSVTYFHATHGIRVLQCGEPIWATIEDVARGRDLDPRAVIEGLKAFLGFSS